MNKKQPNGNRIWIAVLIAMPAVTFLLCLGGAKLILSGNVSEESGKLIVIILTGLVSLAFSLFSSLKSKQQKLLWGIGTAGTYLLILLVSNLLFIGGGFGGILPVAGSVLFGGIAGSFLGAMKKKRYA